MSDICLLPKWKCFEATYVRQIQRYMRELVNLPYELDSQDVLTDAVASKKRQ